MNRDREIYLDNAATTRAWPEVIAAVSHAMGDGFGNGSSGHRRGLQAAREIVAAEEAIVSAVGGGPWRVIFTSGGTEADGLAVLGTVPKGRLTGAVSSTVDHAAVDAACRAAVSRSGGRYVRLSAGERGVVSASDVVSAMDAATGLVSVAYVGGEMGTVQPVADIAEAVRSAAPRCRVHVDAVQALCRQVTLALPPSVDMVTVSAHKIHGPQGIGALLVRPGGHLRPLLYGGDQQGGTRPGTYNLPGIAGFRVAAERLMAMRSGAVPRMTRLAEKLIAGVAAGVPGVTPLGDPSCRAPGMAVMAFVGVTSEVLLHALEGRGVLASASSACHSTRREPPAVLVDAGLGRDAGAVRFSLSMMTAETEIDTAIAVVCESVRALRSGRAG